MSNQRPDDASEMSAAERVVARLDTYSQEQHIAAITEARARRLDRTLGALHRRAESAEARLAAVEALLLCSSVDCPCGGERASVTGDELRKALSHGQD